MENLILKSPNILIFLLGLALLIGWWGGKVSQKVKAPQLVGFIIIGLFLGSSFLNIFSLRVVDKLTPLYYLALALVGFDIGGELVLKNLKKIGKSILLIAIFQVLASFFVVTLGVFLWLGKLPLALLLGAIASATAPATTIAILRERRASGPLTTTLFAVVGIGDGMAIIIYAFASTVAKILIVGRKEVSLLSITSFPLLEIMGSLLIGLIIGLLLIYFTRKVQEREALLVLALGSILLCIGLAIILHLSLILANMALGLTLSNLPRYRRDDIFEVIRQISLPVFILFFILVGARLQLKYLVTLGALGIIYIIARTIGKNLGAYLGARLAKASPNVTKYLGICLLSQGVVAIALSIQAGQEFRTYGQIGYTLGLLTVNIIAGTTLVFQLIGPFLAQLVIVKTGEAYQKG